MPNPYTSLGNCGKAQSRLRLVTKETLIGPFQPPIAIMMESGKAGEVSAYVTFKFSSAILSHLPTNHLLQRNPNIAHHLSQGMKTVDDVIESLQKRFNIPIRVQIMGNQETLLLPDLPANSLTYFSNCFWVEPQRGEYAIGHTSDGVDLFLSLEPNNEADGRQRWCENPSAWQITPAKRQRFSNVYHDLNDSAQKTAGNLVLNAIRPQEDSPASESLTTPECTLSHQMDRTPEQSTSTSQETSSSVSRGQHAVSWSLAGMKCVKRGQIIQVKFRKDEGDQCTDISTVVEVNKYTIITKCGNVTVCKPWKVIKEIRILEVNGEVVYDSDV